MTIRRLAYLDFGVSDLDTWRALAVDVLGAELRGDSPPTEVLLRLDERHHRIRLVQAAEDALVAVGWEVDDERALDAAGARIREFGIEVERVGDAAAAARGVAGLARFRDPQGVACELAWGACDTGTPMRPSRPLSGFKTGELGIGHVVFMAADLEKGSTFYRDALGFRVSDVIVVSGMRAMFLHCNARHHSIALVEAPTPDLNGRLLHFMLEVQSLDDVGRAYDRCLDGAAPIALSLGRHTNDQMTSFYLRTPSDFEIEYGWGGRELPDGDFVAGSYSAPSRWGHRPLLDERATP